jgi:hypothetical protein
MIRRAIGIAAATVVAAGVAAAQDEIGAQFVRMEKVPAQVKMVGLQGAVMGRTVKGAPYSGVEINESTQVLADGTRIHNESQTQVYRDSEGRVRRETPTDVTIFDPVGNASYVLNPKTQTARKLPLGMYVFNTATADGKTLMTNFSYRVTPDKPGDPETEAKLMAETKAMAAELKATHMGVGAGAGSGAGAGMGVTTMTTVGPLGAVSMDRKVMSRSPGTTEALGKRMIEGVNSDGSRVVSTLEAGAIGNDRPIQSVSERWFSQDLQTVMMTKHTDPRTGEESFRLVNVSRAEPAAYLFQIPAGYQFIDSK